MPTKLLNMYFTIYKDDNNLFGLYFIYIMLILIALASSNGGIIALCIAFLWGVLSTTFSFSDITESAYASPLVLRNHHTNHSTILENSLPIGRKNFLKGRMLYALTTGLLCGLMQIPSIIALFIIKYKEPSLNLNTALLLKLALAFILVIQLSILLGILLRIILMTRRKRKTSEERKRSNAINWVLILVLILANRILPKPNYQPFYYNVNHLLIAIPVIFIIAISIQLIWLFKNIHKIDFNE